MIGSFSRLLAGRYINPLRNTVSVITMVCVVGVALGVTALMVVLAVMKGLEEEMQSRILGFTPHVTVSHIVDDELVPDDGWEDVLDKLVAHPAVESGFPLVEDFVLLEVNGSKRPVRYRSINTEDPERVAAIEELLDKENYPESSADLGYDLAGVFSSSVMNQLGLQVGDVVSIYSAQNFDEVQNALEVTDLEPVQVRFAEEFARLQQIMSSAHVLEGEVEVFEYEALLEVDEALASLQTEPMRVIERDGIDAVRDVLYDAEPDERPSKRRLPVGANAKFAARIAALGEIDLLRADNDALKEMKSIVLPRDVEVRGVYATSVHIAAPEMFIPLSLGSEMKGFDDGVDQLALTLSDPQAATALLEELLPLLPEGSGWRIKSWQYDYGGWLDIVATEQQMMSFVLSLIFVVVAFCVMAVMFIVTMQKRQEIGVMKALGATESQISGVFMIQGVIVGVVGVLLGLVLGWVIIENRAAIQAGLLAMNINVFPAAMHGVPEIPAKSEVITNVKIALAGFFLCVLAAVGPAYRAAKNDPAMSLRGI